MNAQTIERHFAKIGARVKVESDPKRLGGRLSLDVDRDAEGEYFDIRVGKVPSLSIVDANPRIRHLLLMWHRGFRRSKFLCGHDERHWFVAAVPEAMNATNIATAMESLKPARVRALQERLKVKPKQRNRRRNPAFVRQGEWFFVPLQDHPQVNEKFILRNEPLRRGGGKPHMVEELVRQGGEMVYVSARHPNGLTSYQYERLLSNSPKMRKLHWVVQRRNPRVMVRGKIRHADHKTIVLHDWHEVLMNTENQSVAMQHVAFID